ncbi:MAG TPA: hypothetical protein VFZ48_04295 [Candidatus Saccharimonadales bacterium]
MNIPHHKAQEFQQQIWAFYSQNARTMPWRENPDPYWVMVSEIMLQQTQVDRVQPKFIVFMERFPSIRALAKAPLSDVLTVWSGLGYNRRAKFLWQAARQVIEQHQGVVPANLTELMALPGIGPNTAGAIMAYAFNEPVEFVETNIRTVLFHHFFENQEQVSDRELRVVVGALLDTEHPREWYWALMDYGAHLKKQSGGRLSQSKHYKKQSQFAGSVREMRGKIIRTLAPRSLGEFELRREVGADERFAPALAALLAEGLITRHNNGQLSLTDTA